MRFLGESPPRPRFLQSRNGAVLAALGRKLAASQWSFIRPGCVNISHKNVTWCQFPHHAAWDRTALRSFSKSVQRRFWVRQPPKGALSLTNKPKLSVRHETNNAPLPSYFHQPWRNRENVGRWNKDEVDLKFIPRACAWGDGKFFAGSSWL